MENINEIPLSELYEDLQASKDDIILCEKALSMGIDYYSGGSTKERIEKNKKIIHVIEKELERRGATNGTPR